MSSLEKKLREVLDLSSVEDFPYTFPIIWREEVLAKGIGKPIVDAIDLEGSIRFSMEVLAFAAIALSQYLTNISNIKRLPFEDLDLNEYLSKFYTLESILDALNLTGYFNGLTTWTRLSYESMGLSENFLSFVWNIFRSLPESLSLLGYLTRSFLFVLEQAIDIDMTDYMASAWTGFLDRTQHIDIQDTALASVWTIFHTMVDSLTLLGYILYASIVQALLIQVVNIQDYISRLWTTYYPLTQAITIQDISIDRIWNTFYGMVQVIVLQDYTSLSYGYRILRVASLTVLDYMASAWTARPPLTQDITITDSFNRTWDAYVTWIETPIINFVLESFKGFKYTLSPEQLTMSDATSYIIDVVFRLIESMNLVAFITVGQDLTELLDDFILIFDSIIPLRGIVEGIVQTIDLGDYFNRMWQAYMNYPYTIDGILLFGFHGTSQSIIQSLVPELIMINDYLLSALDWIRDIPENLSISDYLFQQMRLALAQSLIVNHYIEYVTNFYRVFSQYLDLNHFLDWVIAITQYFPESLDIEHFYEDAWTILRHVSESTTIVDYLSWTDAWSRTLPESLSIIGVPLFQYFKSIIQLLDVEDYPQTITTFYRSLQEFTDISSFHIHIMQYIKRYSNDMVLDDPFYYVSNTARWLSENVTLLDTSLNYLSQWYTTYAESIDLVDILQRLGDGFITLAESLDIASYFSYTQLWSRWLYDTVTMLADVEWMTDWVREWSESLSVYSIVYLWLRVRISLESITLLSSLNTITGFVRSITEDIGIVDRALYRFVVDVLAILEQMNLQDYVLSASDFYRITLDTLDIEDFTTRTWEYARTLMDPLTVLDTFQAARDIVSDYIGNLSITDYRYSIIGTFPLQQLTLSDQPVFFSMTIKLLEAIQQVDNMFTVWFSKMGMTDVFSMQDTFISPVSEIWSDIQLYLKKVTVSLTARARRY